MEVCVNGIIRQADCNSVTTEQFLHFAHWQMVHFSSMHAYVCIYIYIYINKKLDTEVSDDMRSRQIAEK